MCKFNVLNFISHEITTNQVCKNYKIAGLFDKNIKKHRQIPVFFLNRYTLVSFGYVRNKTITCF